MLKQNKFASLTYNILLYTSFSRTLSFFSRFAGRLYGALDNKLPLATTIHGRKVIIPPGYPYPYTARTYSTFNNPLLELVHQEALTKKRPVSVVDVGAAIGDTTLFLLANCGPDIERVHAIDGDEEFFAYLQNNLKHSDKVTLHHALLSSHAGTERELLRTHSGTASAQGSNLADCTTLDLLLGQASTGGLDVIKTDVDGFDGEILAGAAQVLGTFKPSVIFEWHPILYKQTKNRIEAPFEVLSGLGYCNFVFFNKFGVFSHFMAGYDHKSLSLLAEVCLRNRHYEDWHYDIIALHRESGVHPLDIAELIFAKAKRSLF